MKNLLLAWLILFSFQSFTQVGINATGTAPTPSAMLDVSSTNMGILIPRMTTIQKNAIPNKVEGLMVYDTDSKLFSFWVGSGPIGYWTDFPQTVTQTSNYWTLNGSDISSNNAGNVGIGILNPTLAKFQVVESNTNQPVHSTIWANNTSNGNGITGNAFNAGIGIWGTSGTGTGVEGRTAGNTANSYGIFGNATGSGTGGYFYSGSGTSLIANGIVSIGGNPWVNNMGQSLKNILEVHGTNNKIGNQDNYRCLSLFSNSDATSWDLYVQDNNPNLVLRAPATFSNASLEVGYFDKSSGQYFPISDKNLKTQILPLSNILYKVLKLKPSSYQFITNDNNHRNEIGLIAQEVEDLFPEFVGKNKDGAGVDKYALNYAGLSVIALKAIQEQQKMIMVLKNEIRILKKKMR